MISGLLNNHLEKHLTFKYLSNQDLKDTVDYMRDNNFIASSFNMTECHLDKESIDYLVNHYNDKIIELNLSEMALTDRDLESLQRLPNLKGLVIIANQQPLSFEPLKKLNLDYLAVSYKDDGGKINYHFFDRKAHLLPSAGKMFASSHPSEELQSSFSPCSETSFLPLFNRPRSSSLESDEVLKPTRRLVVS